MEFINFLKLFSGTNIQTNEEVAIKLVSGLFFIFYFFWFSTLEYV